MLQQGPWVVVTQTLCTKIFTVYCVPLSWTRCQSGVCDIFFSCSFRDISLSAVWVCITSSSFYLEVCLAYELCRLIFFIQFGSLGAFFLQILLLPLLSFPFGIFITNVHTLDSLTGFWGKVHFFPQNYYQTFEFSHDVVRRSVSSLPIKLVLWNSKKPF